MRTTSSLKSSKLYNDSACNWNLYNKFRNYRCRDIIGTDPNLSDRKTDLHPNRLPGSLSPAFCFRGKEPCYFNLISAFQLRCFLPSLPMPHSHETADLMSSRVTWQLKSGKMDAPQSMRLKKRNVERKNGIDSYGFRVLCSTAARDKAQEFPSIPIHLPNRSQTST